MNSINKFLLWLALLPKARYEKMGINFHQLKAILKAKLTIDDRTPSTFQQLRRRANKEGKVTASRIWSVLASVFMGALFLGFSVAFFNEDIMRLTFYFAFFITMFSLSLISDFTSVLIDVRDNYIILPKPVNDKTVLMARLLYILVYLIRIAFPMSLPGIIYIAISKGLWPMVVFMLIIVLITLFTIFLVNAIYLVILKITTPHKFQSIISYIQILFTVLLYASYQLLPRLVRSSGMADYDINAASWKWLVPSYWFAGGWECMSALNTSTQYIIAGIVGVIVPLASIWLVIKYMAPSFNKKLLLITNSDARESTTIKRRKGMLSSISGYSAKMARWATKRGAERMSFVFVWKMTARSRDYRMKVLPAMGYIVVMIAMLFLKRGKSINIENIQDGGNAAAIFVIAPIYIASFFLFTALSQLVYSEKYKASWIYHIAPVEIPGQLLIGAIKSVFVKFLLPFDLLIFIGGIMLCGISILPNLLLGISNQLFICGIFTLFNMKGLPFSEQQSAAQNTTKAIKNVVMMIVLTIPVGLHYLVYDYIWMVIPLGLLSLTGAYFIMRDIRKRTWRELYPGQIKM